MKNPFRERTWGEENALRKKEVVDNKPERNRALRGEVKEDVDNNLESETVDRVVEKVEPDEENPEKTEAEIQEVRGRIENMPDKAEQEKDENDKAGQIEKKYSGEELFEKAREEKFEEAKKRHPDHTSVREALNSSKSSKEKIIDAMERAQKKFSHFMGEFGVGSMLLEKRAREEVLKNIELINDFFKAGGNYLDIGCGKGHIMHELEKINSDKPIQFIGIDIYDRPTNKVRKQIALTRKKEVEPRLKEIEDETGEDMLNLDFGKLREKEPQTFSFATADKLPFKDKVFDGATMFYLLHHLKPEIQKKAMEEAKRIIGDDPDQYIFVLEEIADSERQKRISEKHDMLVNPEIKFGETPHGYGSDQEWKDFFEESDMEVVKTHYYSIGSKEKPLEEAFYVLKKIEKEEKTERV